MAGEEQTIQITGAFRLPLAELTFRATRAGGPGGQHVNRSATRVELWWNAATSPSLTEVQRGLLLARLGHRIDQAGFLRLVSGARRSQAQNRDAAIERLQTLLAEALRIERPRKATRPTRASVERRLDQKKRRGSRKRERRRPGSDDG